MSLFASDGLTNHNPSTGGVVERNDSVLISYDDLRIVNSKLVQLKYERDINNNLRSIIANDSIIIKDYETINTRLTKDYKKAIRQRNFAIGTTALFLIVSILLLVK